MFEPGFKRNLEVNDGKEWIDSVLLLDNVVEDAFIVQERLTLVLDGQSHQIDLKLGSELINLHLPVNFHVSVSSSHASVQHLVEVDVTVVTLNSHFQ